MGSARVFLAAGAVVALFGRESADPFSANTLLTAYPRVVICHSAHPTIHQPLPHSTNERRACRGPAHPNRTRSAVQSVVRLHMERPLGWWVGEWVQISTEMGCECRQRARVASDWDPHSLE